MHAIAGLFFLSGSDFQDKLPLAFINVEALWYFEIQIFFAHPCVKPVFRCFTCNKNRYFSLFQAFQNIIYVHIFHV